MSLDDGLVLYLPLSEGYGDRVWDRSQGQNNGTVNGAVWVEPFNDDSKGAWLRGWSKRIKITISSDDVDEDLTDFPVLIMLSSSTGKNGADLTCVFDEVGSSYQKIAVTTRNGIQCPVEVVSWDDTGEVAELWVKVPSISSSEDTILYLYYDASHSDNTDYVGLTGSTPATSVWSNGYVGVWHMNESTTDTVPDSTSNGNDGTVNGTLTGTVYGATWTTGKYDGGLNFDGDDYVSLGQPSSLDFTSSFTVSVWVKFNSLATEQQIIGRSDGWVLWYDPANDFIRFAFFDGTVYVGQVDITQFSIKVSVGEWCHISACFDDANDVTKIYLNGSLETTVTGITQTPSMGAYDTEIGRFETGRYLNAVVDDVRLYNRVLSDTEIQGLYYGEDVGGGRVLCLRLDEGTGTTVYSDNRCDGKIGKGQSFDDGDTITCSGITPTNVTVTAWVNISKQDYHGIVAQDSSNWGDGGYFLRVDGPAEGNDFAFFVFDGSTAEPRADVGQSISLKTWYFAAGVFDGSKIYVYQDGQLKESQDRAITIDYGTGGNLVLGATGSGGSPLTGMLDEVHVYDEAKGSEWISASYKTQSNSFLSFGGEESYLSDGPDWKYGCALTFDGVDDYVEVQHSSDLNLDEFTISAWIKIANLPSVSNGHFEITGKNWNVLRFYIDRDNRRPRVTINKDGSNVTLESSRTLNIGEWYHVVFSCKSGEQSIIVDGEREVIGNYTYSNLGKNTSSLYIGVYNLVSGFYTEGIVDNVRVYNRALSQEEIRTLYTKTSGRHG